jgi:hypothetical protein
MASGQVRIGRQSGQYRTSLHLNSFRFAVICAQFDERGGKCFIRSLKPTQDISDA